jgi:hypothetical protein
MSFDMEEIISMWDDVDPEDYHPQDKFLSLDLEEATYNMTFQVLEAQTETLDQIMGDFPIWTIFRDVWSTFEREVCMDNIADQGLLPDGCPLSFITTRGSFMGDTLSFIHLTLFLAASVNQSTFFGRKPKLRFKRPIGGSVGDDLIILGVEKQFCDYFNKTISDLCMVTSKLNATSSYAMTYCEQYAARPSDFESIKDLIPKDSRFGNLIFLDIIKGSILSGKTKVNASKNDPFFGHSNMLNKQVAWHPISWVKERSIRLLWAANYMAAHKLSNAMASLPRSLGGIDMAIGTTLEYDTPTFKEGMLPYYERILSYPVEEFLLYSTLLAGVFQGNPKGVPWSNNEMIISTFLSTCELVDRETVAQLVPEYVHRTGGWGAWY